LFTEVLNSGGSIQYGLGSAVEEARRFGVLLLPPCVNRSGDRFVVEPATVDNRWATGAIRVPAYCDTRTRPEAAQHIAAVRAAFGEFTSLLDFCRKVDRRLVSRHDIQLLSTLGAFGFTGLSRAQLPYKRSTGCETDGPSAVRLPAARILTSSSLAWDSVSNPEQRFRILTGRTCPSTLRTCTLGTDWYRVQATEPSVICTLTPGQ